MVVTERCDVYSFGVVALETLIGRYPREMLPSLLSLSSQKTMLYEVLDQRLPPPDQVVAHDIVLIAAPKVFGHHIKELYVKLAFKQKRSI